MIPGTVPKNVNIPESDEKSVDSMDQSEVVIRFHTLVIFQFFIVVVFIVWSPVDN